ncbi:MAG: hypothetical protein AABM67_01685 [Acidobacteriota bacterium]
MHRILAVLFVPVIFVFAFPAGSVAQSADPIASIRQHYAQINRNAALYKKVKKELSGFSAEGGELLAYFHGPSVMKIVATFFGESGKASEEYYFWDGQLIFVLRKDFQYNKPLSGKVIRTTENRFYFNSGKLIRWIDENAKEVGSDAPTYQEKQKEYLETSKQFSDGAGSKNPTIENNQ